MKTDTTPEKMAILLSFENLIKVAPDLQLVQVAGAIEDLGNADPKMTRMLRGSYLLNDIFNRIREELQSREQRYATG